MEKKTIFMVLGLAVFIVALASVGFLMKNNLENPLQKAQKASNLGSVCEFSEEVQVYNYEGYQGSKVKETQKITTELDCCMTYEGVIETTNVDGTVTNEDYEFTKCE